MVDFVERLISVCFLVLLSKYLPSSTYLYLCLSRSVGNTGVLYILDSSFDKTISYHYYIYHASKLFINIYQRWCWYNPIYFSHIHVAISGLIFHWLHWSPHIALFWLYSSCYFLPLPGHFFHFFDSMRSIRSMWCDITDIYINVFTSIMYFCIHFDVKRQYYQCKLTWLFLIYPYYILFV